MPEEVRIGIGEIKITEVELLDRLLLLGGPGLGKTEIIKQKAQEEAKRLKREFVDLREVDDFTKIEENPSRYYIFLRVVAPHVFTEDLGIPRFREGYVEFLPPRVLRILTLKDIVGVLFIDEITNVQRDDQFSMYYSLVLEKEFSWNLKLSKGIKVVLAGNTAEWSELSRSLPKPLRNRLIIVHASPPTVDEWIDYMFKKYGDGWEKLVAAYLKIYPEDLLKPPPEGDDFSAFPTPRSWTLLATLLTSTKRSMREAIIIGTIGKEVGTRLISIMHDLDKVESIIEKIKQDPRKTFESLKPSEKILISYYLAQHYNKYIDIIAALPHEWIIVIITLIPISQRLNLLKKLPQNVVKEISRFVITLQ
ncbi:MAG: AAA family ATPase [Pyrobaculum sp.]